MPSYKFDSESESEPDVGDQEIDNEVSDDGEPGPDDTFHFRHSFTKAPRRQRAHHPQLDEDMNEPSFQTDEGDDLPEQSFEEMHEDEGSYLLEESIITEDEEEDIEEYENDPLAAAVRIEKRSNWLEQIEYTDRAVKRLKAIDIRERMLNERIHWGGRVPDIKYSTEDLERDLFGETPQSNKRSGLDYLQADALKQGIFDQKSWEAKELERGKPNPTFRICWGPGDVLIHLPGVRNRALDSGVISFTKLHLFAVENDAAEKQAQKLLERQLEHTTFTTDRSGIPMATPSSTLQFNTFCDTSSLHTGQIRPTDEYEHNLWQLASILFDNLLPNTTETTHRKRELSKFFKDLVSKSVWNEHSRSRDPAERIFLSLSGYRISEACSEAIKSKDLHLATLLALAEESRPEFRQDLHHQLESWRKDGSLGDIQLWYRAIYEVLAGEIDLRGNALGLLGVGQRIDWRRSFAMRLWFGIPADGGIKDAVQEFWMACQQDSTIAKPVPWYTSITQKTSTGVYDGLFQLLRLYAGSGVGNTLDDALNPYNFTSAVMDVRVSWHLYLILSQLYGKASFSDIHGKTMISDIGERLTLSYVSQLEHLSLWQWSIFVALHLRRENTRKGIIIDLLARYIATIPSQLEEQGIISRFVDHWKIPVEWILEAKALHSRSQGNHYLCAKNLVLAKSLVEAQKTILMHIAPQAVISTHLADLEELLLMFDSRHPQGWEIGGQIYLDYISLVQERGGAERRRRGSGSRKDSVVRLLRALPSMEARSFEQRVAQSEMAKVVADIIVSSSEMSREITGVMRLPLLEGDALRITRKIASGMLDQILAA